MKIIYTTLLSLFIMSFACHGQDTAVNWGKARNWRLYDISDDNAFGYSVDTLNHFRSLQLDSNAMKRLLRDARIWPKEKYSLWMGLFVASCEIDGKLRKVDISTYGGFFFDEEQKRYYQVSDVQKAKWKEFWNEARERLNYISN